ncbi:MAG: ribosome silencing factor [Actinobacteria bacterium]|jgi:ribosome-associated protein|nr:ribosome silencing factor [Actinomycetota bacterium]
MPVRDSTVSLTQLAGQAIAEKLGFDLVALDLSAEMVLSEVFLIASARNERQVEAIADEVERVLSESGEKPVRRERTANWVLLDYSDLVVHIQSEEARRYYMLDRLWNDCPKIDLHLDLDTRSIKDVQ